MNVQGISENRDLTEDELDRTAGGWLNVVVCAAIAGAQAAAGVHPAYINTNGCGQVADALR
jgi:hypothetical protein